MSKKESNIKEVNKVQTKYDRKMQQRKEIEAREKKEKIRNRIIAIVAIVIVLCFIISFPIKSYSAKNQPYITINDEKITQIEFDYNYNLAKNSYINQYSSYLSMFGMSDVSTIESQTYSDTMTFGDYFAQLATENITKTKALTKEANEANFVYDVTEDYNDLMNELNEMATSSETTLNKFLQANYGTYATESKLEEIIKESIRTSAYYDKIVEDSAPSQDEITAYYNENKDTYDSINYRLTTINAELPTTKPDGTMPTDEEGNEVAYEPTEEEIATAMEDAKILAESALVTISDDGELNEGSKMSSIPSLLQEYLFDTSRKEGDATIITDESNNRYYVVEFIERYLDQTPSINMRAIITESRDASAILEEWINGEATEESFIAIANLYDENDMSDNEFLYEGILPSGLEQELADWIYEGNRQKGDTTAITTEDGVNYVLYYLEENAPEWSLLIKSTLLSTIMTEYLEEITTDFTVVDKKGNLKYLQIEN